MKKYEILGDNLPVVVCELFPGESMICLLYTSDAADEL